MWAEEQVLGPRVRTAVLLLFVHDDAIDRLAFGVRTLGRRGPALAIGGNRDGLVDDDFSAPLGRDVVRVRIDSFDRGHVTVGAVAGDRVVLAVVLGTDRPLIRRPFRRGHLGGELDPVAVLFYFGSPALHGRTL